MLRSIKEGLGWTNSSQARFGLQSLKLNIKRAVQLKVQLKRIDKLPPIATHPFLHG